MTDVVVLCGGYGTRLQAVLLPGYPKAMVDVNGKPFLGILLDHLIANGFKRIILCTGYGANYICDYVLYSWYSWGHRQSGTQVFFSYEGDKPIGTWGAIIRASEQVQSDPFLVLNGDTFCALDYDDLLRLHDERTNFKLTSAVDGNRVPVGAFVLSKAALICGAVNLEDAIAKLRAVVPEYVAERITAAPWYDIGTPAGLERFRQERK